MMMLGMLPSLEMVSSLLTVSSLPTMSLISTGLYFSTHGTVSLILPCCVVGLAPTRAWCEGSKEGEREGDVFKFKHEK